MDASSRSMIGSSMMCLMEETIIFVRWLIVLSFSPGLAVQAIIIPQVNPFDNRVFTYIPEVVGASFVLVEQALVNADIAYPYVRRLHLTAAKHL